jgi:PmbA protein
MAMAAEAPEDEFAGLAPPDLLAKGQLADLDLDDGWAIDPVALRERAREAEDSARSVAGVTNSNGGSSSASRSIVALATSDGFANAYRASGHSCSVSVVAGEGSSMQRDYAWHSARHLEDLEAPSAIGRRAGERTVKKLGPVTFSGGEMAVLFEPRVATTLLGHFAAAINGASIARQGSFLLGKLGEKVFADGVTLVDDPTRKGALRSRLFDGEGLPVKRMELVSDGRLNGWLAASAAARQLGIAPTGHAVRGISGPPGAGPSNLYIEPGARSREEMIAGEDRAVFVTELIGQGVNGLTGD